jgi:dipeptidyl aminopeptidase/acylaminoacyl peptidase
VCIAASSVHASERYDPRLRFRTISTPRFDIHFHQGEEAMARRLAVLAEQVSADMEPRLGRPRGRVNVILVNQTDLSNGWATPVPYNLIEIVATSPRADSVIGNSNDWLRLVFTHEYTHVLHLERSSGLLGAIGRPFGRLPLFYPNLFLPPMLIEGIATHEEGAITGQGRVPAGDFRMLLDRAAASRRFPSLAKASNVVVDWPSGLTPYVYGAYFHEYLAKTFGEQSLARLADATSGRIPYLGVRAFRQVYGKTLGELWAEFEHASRAGSGTSTSTAKRLTRHGFIVSSPWYLPDGRLFYSIANPHTFPALMELTRNGPREVATRVIGNRMGGTRREVVFDQVEFVNSVALQFDLFAVDLETGSVRRLTRGARASDPHVSPDETTIVCTVQREDRRELALLRMPQSGTGTPVALLSEPDVDFASPRWSPDGRTIAAERRAVGGGSEIVVLEAATGTVIRRVALDRASRVTSPAWSPDGRTLYFASDRGGRPFQIYAFDAQTGTFRRLTNAGDSAQSPVISPDGRTMVFVGYTENGFDLFSTTLDGAAWESTGIESVAGSVDQPPSGVTTTRAAPSSTYNPLRTLAPRFWTPVIEADDDELAVGAATGGLDALGRHWYFGSATWSTRARPDWTAGYAYDRWRPTVFADLSDDTDPWQEGTVRVTETNVGALIRFRTVRRSQTLYGSFHGASEKFDCASCVEPVDTTIDRRALRAAWSFDTSRRYGYSISDEYGLLITASTEWTRKSLGADGNAGAGIVVGRGYVALGPRLAALAVRAAAASAWGDRSVRRRFAAAGSGAQSGGIAFDFDAIALVRGFDTDAVSGRNAAVINVDYRLPLVWLERGVGTWPLFARSVHAAAFSDVGAAWNSRLSRTNRRASFGAELSADIVVGYQLPFTVAAGAAWRHDPTGESRGATLFARLGRAF